MEFLKYGIYLHNSEPLESKTNLNLKKIVVVISALR